MHRINIYFLFFTHNEPKLSLEILEVTSICRIHLRTCFEYAVSSETFHGSLWSKQNFPVHYDIDKSNDHNVQVFDANGQERYKQKGGPDEIFDIAFSK